MQDGALETKIRSYSPSFFFKPFLQYKTFTGVAAVLKGFHFTAGIELAFTETCKETPDELSLEAVARSSAGFARSTYVFPSMDFGRDLLDLTDL